MSRAVRVMRVPDRPQVRPQVRERLLHPDRSPGRVTPSVAMPNWATTTATAPKPIRSRRGTIARADSPRDEPKAFDEPCCAGSYATPGKPHRSRHSG